jgi:thiamine-monophosphate kinase
MDGDMGDLGEREFLRRLRARAGSGTSVLRVGIGDDAAVLRPPRGSEVVVTTDLMLEGVHFRRDWHSAGMVGARCLTRGVSDLAAMGARPTAAFLSLGLPPGDLAWGEAFLEGVLGLAREYGVELAGGDLAESRGGAVADIVLTGSVPRGRALLRSGARRGDFVYVTGELGGAAADLARLRGGGRAEHVARARVEVGEFLMRRGIASACIDLSDGLSTDLDHLCEESGVGAEVSSAAVPVARGSSLEMAVNGGEDYELLFTAAGRVPKVIAGVAVSRIGRVVKARKGGRVWVDGSVLEVRGWEHFR